MAHVDFSASLSGGYKVDKEGRFVFVREFVWVRVDILCELGTCGASCL